MQRAQGEVWWDSHRCIVFLDILACHQALACLDRVEGGEACPHGFPQGLHSAGSEQCSPREWVPWIISAQYGLMVLRDPHFNQLQGLTPPASLAFKLQPTFCLWSYRKWVAAVSPRVNMTCNNFWNRKKGVMVRFCGGWQKKHKLKGCPLIPHLYKCAKMCSLSQTHWLHSRSDSLFIFSLALEFYLTFSQNLSGVLPFNIFLIQKGVITLLSCFFLIKNFYWDIFFLIFPWNSTQLCESVESGRGHPKNYSCYLLAIPGHVLPLWFPL